MLKQRPKQYQGLYVVTAEGKVLANRAAAPNRGSWEADTLKMLDEGVEAFGEVNTRKPRWVDPKPHRGVGVRDDGSVVLAVYLRPMTLKFDKRGLGQVALDNVVLTRKERGTLAPAQAEVGDSWRIPTDVVAAFHRVLSPTSDANTLARRDEVTKAALSGRVERVRDGIAYLRFTGAIAGAHTWEFGEHKGKKIRGEVELRGVGTSDARTGHLLSLTLVGDGTYRFHAPWDYESKYGAVVEWRHKKPD